MRWGEDRFADTRSDRMDKQPGVSAGDYEGSATCRSEGYSIMYAPEAGMKLSAGGALSTGATDAVSSIALHFYVDGFDM